MTAARVQPPRLIERLPEVRGRYSENVVLAAITWFRVGGPAEVVFRPTDLDDLLVFLGNKPADVPVTVIGVGSNLLVRDGGIEGVVVRLGRGFAYIEISGAEARVGAGALDINVSFACLEAGVAGLEFLRGIPGTIGGALRMNAGTYGRAMADVLVEAQAVDMDGGLHRLAPADMDLGYRHCGVPEDWIFVAATLQGEAGERTAIAARMGEIKHARETSQPLRSRTGGSTFVNPEGARAWELIDRAGCRGLRRGAAMVSEQHCNFLINTGEASAADIEALGEEVRRRVADVTGTTLKWEIRRVGRHADGAGPTREGGQ